MSKLNLALIPTAFILLASFTFLAVSAQENEIVVGPQTITVQAYPGRYAETTVRVENKLNFSVIFVAANAEGDIRDLIALNNTRSMIPPGGVGELPIAFYVFHKSVPGSYNGLIVVSTGTVVKRIPFTLNVLSPEELLRANLTVESFKDTFRVGDVLSVVSDVSNLGEGDLRATLKLTVLDPDTGRILNSAEKDVVVPTVASVVLNVALPEDIEAKEYLIEGVLYSTSRGEEAGFITSSTAAVTVRQSVIGEATKFFQERLDSGRLRVYMSLVPVLAIILAAYVHFKREAERKRRYLESINFEALPRPGRGSAFVGRVAETTTRAYMPLNELMNHTLCAGATGYGKTVASQVIAEEALLKGLSVIVFDPTAQWSGFIRACKSNGMLKLYSRFGLKRSQAKAFNGNVHIVDDPHYRISVERHLKPSEVTVFCMHKLTPTQMDVFVENTVKEIFNAKLDETSQLKYLMVYEEVHRLLPKFGGSGRGFVYLERAAREFRKWGVGLVLISQVLSDFVGEIKANIGTEVQMRTRYEKDLNRIKLKYNVDIMHSVVKGRVGTGMLQNAQYNQGRPYFISFRPLLHDSHRLSDEVLDKYQKYNRMLDDLSDKIRKYKLVGDDVFDLELEFNLASENLKRGLFEVVELYIQSLEPKVREHYGSLTDRQRSDVEAIEDQEKNFLDRSREIEKKIDADIGSLSMLRKKGKGDEYWREALDREREKVEEELKAHREEVKLIEERLLKIRRIVRENDEAKKRVKGVNADVDGRAEDDKTGGESGGEQG